MPTIDSALRLESQAASASVPIPGTDLTLNYTGDRVFGRASPRTVDVPLTGSQPPDSLKRVDLTIEVAGQTHELEFPPDPDQVHTFTWDGRDNFGNRVQGTQTARIGLGYVYDAAYTEAAVDQGGAFNSRPGVTIEGSQSRDEITLVTEYEVDLGSTDASRLGFAGWSLSPHHVADDSRTTTTLLLGNGGSRSIDPTSNNEIDKTPIAALDPLRQRTTMSTAVGPDGQLTVAIHSRNFDDESQTKDVIYDVTDDEFDQLLGGEFIGDVATLVAGGDGQFFGLTDVAYGSEGGLYVLDEPEDSGVFRVGRIAPDGTYEKIAGLVDSFPPTTYEDSFDAWMDKNEGKLATEVRLPFAYRMDVANSGDVYVQVGSADRYPNEDDWGLGVVRISPDGRLYRVYKTDLTGDAADAWKSLAVGPSGDVYVGEPGRIRRIDGQGNVRNVVGLGPTNTRGPDDPDHLVPSNEATVGIVAGLDVDPSGTVYFADMPGDSYLAGNDTHFRALDQEVQVRRVAGYGPDPINEEDALGGVPADSVYWPNDGTFMNYHYLTVGADGSVYFNRRWFNDNFDPTFGRVRTGGGKVAASGNRIPSRDGTELYELSEGRHVRTVDTLTGTTLYEFGYDGAGRLTSVTDRNGSVVQVERDADGNPTAIVAPDGRRLEMTVTDGFITGISRPDNKDLSFTYGDGGLLERITHPSGDETVFQYDSLGRVSGRTRPTGGQDDLIREEIADGHRITHVTPELRETTIDVERTAAGRRVTTQCCGSAAATETLITPDGEWQTSYPDGGSRTTQQGGDPRFGGRSPLPSSVTYQSPSGHSTTTELTRSVTLADQSDPLSLTAFTETSTVNGRSFERSYDPDADRLTVTTPAGRTMTVDLDAGRATTISPDGMDGLSISYDADGSVAGFGRAGAESTLEYDADGNVSAVTDPAGRRTEMTLSAGEYPDSFTTPAGNTTTLSYDADGYLSSFTRPNGETHEYEFDAAGHMTGYTPPEGGTRSISYDADGLPAEVSLPSGRTVTNDFGTTTRLQEASHPDATVTYDYDSMKRVTGLTRSPADGGTDQSLSRTRDGELTTEITFSGPASGTFQYAHDADGRIEEITYPDGTTRALSHDDDGLLTGEGPFTIERNGPMGRPSRISDFTGVVKYTYDAKGRVATRTHTVDGSEIYAVEYTYDASDLLVERTETLPSGQRTEAFSYDADGRLTEVQRNGSVVESYAYDGNGNRTERTVDGTTETASYDPGDRLVDQGSLTYGYDADGHVTDRGGDTLDYSATGELLAYTQQSGTAVDYTADGYGRRVARTAPDGTTTEYLYGDPNDPTQVTAVREDGQWTRYHYDPDGLLYAFERGGSWYYVATDQVGTPRVVVDSNGTVVREIDRDAYGAVRSDSDPSFTLHVGFAGGLPDPTTGLVRFGMRDYDPATGRWLARDPLLLVSGQFNFYSYVENDPVNAVDPTGLSWECFAEKMLENFDETREYTDVIGNLLNELGVDTGTDLKLKELFKAGLKEYMKELAKGKAKKAAAKAAGKSVLKSVARGGYYNLALYGGMLVGSGIHAGIDQFFGQGPGEALHELIHGPRRSLTPCEARERGLIDEDCPEKILEDCC